MTVEKRKYEKKRRAELEAETRRHITETAVELHGTVGPARTSISAIAERAGVRRSTVYRHFPDEAALFDACSSHWAEANPLPDIGAWAAIEDPDERLRTALAELYGFYSRTEEMLENLHRDEETVPIVRRRFAGYREYLAAARDVCCAAALHAAAAATRRAPRSATRSPSRPGARSRATRASTTHRRPS